LIEEFGAMAQRHFEGLAYWGTRTGMRLAIWTVKIIPRRLLYFIADSVAMLAFYLFRAFRTRSVGNLHAALGNDSSANQIRQIARNSLKNFFRVFVEVAISLAADTEKLRNMVSVLGREHLNAGLAKGNGVILLGAHLGNFFLLGTRLAMSGYPIHVLVNQPRHGRFAELMDQYRLQVLQRTIHARPRRDALKEVAKVLRRNEVAIIIADEYRRTGSGIRVPFFGGFVLARRGPVTLALRTGAAVVPAYVVRDHDNTLKLIIEPEIELIRSERDQSQIRENISRLTQWLEKTVRRYPDQWNWMNIKWDDVSNNVLVTKKHGLEQLTH
jgi:KDO2-lipid IV(A) lauroyltransferase